MEEIKMTKFKEYLRSKGATHDSDPIKLPIAHPTTVWVRTMPAYSVIAHY